MFEQYAHTVQHEGTDVNVEIAAAATAAGGSLFHSGAVWETAHLCTVFRIKSAYRQTFRQHRIPLYS